MSAFDFGAAATELPAFTAGDSLLRKGNYVVVVTELDNTTSRRGDAMLKVKVECEDGVQYDNLVVVPDNDYVELMFSKVLALIDAAGLPRPSVEKGEIDPKTGALSDVYAAQIQGKRVGILVRDEQETENRVDNANYGKQITKPRINGRYVPPSKLNGSTGAHGGAAKPSQDDDDEIPF